MVILSKIQEHAVSNPNKIAVGVDGATRTYQELLTNACAFIDVLGTLPKDRSKASYRDNVSRLAVIDLGNRIEFAELFAGATASKYACSVIDRAMKRPQIEQILSRLEPDIVVTDDESPVASAARDLNLAVVTPEQLPSKADGAESTFGTEGSEGSNGTFLVTFTSGTTAEPKAIARSRASWRESLRRSTQVFGLGETTVTFCPGSLVHGLAMYALMESLYAGGTYITNLRWDANSAADTIRLEHANRIVAVPTMLTGLSTKASANEPYKTVTRVLTAGEKLTGNHLSTARRLFPNAIVQEYYGASELGFITVANLHPSNDDTFHHGVGYPFPGVQIKILDTETNEVENGEVGTIFVETDLASDEYLWGDDDCSFRRLGTLSTVGDIGKIAPNGALQVLGREGGMITTGGHNVYPSEVEGVLKNIPGVDDAMAFGLPDPYLGTRLVVIYLSAQVDENEIQERALAVLPRYKCPREFRKMTAFPLTTSGKIARGDIEKDLLVGRQGVE